MVLLEIHKPSVGCHAKRSAAMLFRISKTYPGKRATCHPRINKAKKLPRYDNPLDRRYDTPMSHPTIKRALISVYDKTGVVDFARALHREFGIEIISTGGTAKLLKENDIPVTLVEEVTGFPEMMNGRVKTLHPKIHAGILADRDNPEHMRQLDEQGIKPIDMVVVNLYPFEKTVADPDCTFEQAIEMIDIGGPCMLRAAAKNHRHVIPAVHARSHEFILEALQEDGDLAESGRACLASIAFEATANYDEVVETYLSRRWYDLRHNGYAKGEENLRNLLASVSNSAETPHAGLRYGENPHQTAETEEAKEGSAAVSVIPNELTGWSYNNLADADAAARLCNDLARELSGTANKCVFVKHTNSCGSGLADDPIEAYRRAYIGDPNAAMGGILACSFEVNAEFAEVVMNTYARWGKDVGAGGFFIEVWVAPGFDDDAIKIIRESKKWGERVRLLDVCSMNQAPNKDEVEYKTISGGMLKQTRDNVGLCEDQWKVATKRQPTDQELSDLRLSWLVAKHTKSNAISVCKDGMLIGNGAGQMSRVMSCRIATWLAEENGHKAKLAGSVAASDAFFPFSDGPSILMDAGITAIIQPGGSKRDEDTIKACDERGVAMIFTGTRHFKH